MYCLPLKNWILWENNNVIGGLALLPLICIWKNGNEHFKTKWLWFRSFDLTRMYCRLPLALWGLGPSCTLRLGSRMKWEMDRRTLIMKVMSDSDSKRDLKITGATMAGEQSSNTWDSFTAMCPLSRLPGRPWRTRHTRSPGRTRCTKLAGKKPTLSPLLPWKMENVQNRGDWMQHSKFMRFISVTEGLIIYFVCFDMFVALQGCCAR